MDARSGFKIASRGGDHFGGTGDGAGGVIARFGAFVVVREDGQDPVADEFIDVAGMPHDDGDHGLHVGIEKIDHEGGVFGLAKSRETANIGEEDGDGLALTGERDCLRFFERLGYLFADEQGDRATKKAAFSFGGGEAVDEAAEQGDREGKQDLE